MEKFNKFLAILKKYQFWVICGFVLITAFTCWWVATIGLAGQFKQRKSKLEEEFKGVQIEPNHPNQGVIDKIHEQHDALKLGVYDAWEILYSEQKQKNRFPTVLGEDFKRRFENLKPQEELGLEYREVYQNFIMKYFPTLLQMIDVRRPAEEKEAEAAAHVRDEMPAGPGGRLPRGGAGLGLGGMSGRAMTGIGGDATGQQDWVGTVDWNDSDYQSLLARFEWRETPSTLAVVLAQEDLWVYEALLRVIKNTNEGASSYATAAVKRINTIQIGAEAASAGAGSELFHAAPAGSLAGPEGGGPGAMMAGPPALGRAHGTWAWAWAWKGRAVGGRHYRAMLKNNGSSRTVTSTTKASPCPSILPTPTPSIRTPSSR